MCIGYQQWHGVAKEVRNDGCGGSSGRGHLQIAGEGKNNFDFRNVVILLALS